jgi:hypothetical protein
VAALSFQLDRGLLAGDSEAGRQALHDTLAAVFDSARGEVEQAIREGVIDPTAEASDERRVTLSRGLARLSPARAAELRTRLQALYEEFGDDADPDDRAYGFVFALYPMPRPSGVEATDTDDEATEGATRCLTRPPRPPLASATSFGSPTSAASTSPSRSPTSATE